MRGKSTVDQIFTLKEITSKYWEYNKDLYILFIDFAKAYDSITRTKIWEVMRKYKIPEKLVRLTRMCVLNSKAKIKVDTEYSETFEINTGVRQGDALSPILFNLVMEEALKKASNTQ